MKGSASWTSYQAAIIAIPTSILFIYTGMSDPINLPKLMVLIACSLFSILLYVAHLIYRTNKIYQFGLIHLLYLSFIFFAGLVGFLNSSNIVRYLFGSVGRNNGFLYYLCVCFLAFVILSIPIESEHLKYAIRWLGISAIVLGSYSLIQFLNLDPVNWSSGLNRVIGTLGNPNFSASALGVLSILFLYLALFGDYGSSARIVGIFFSIMLAFLAWATESLQGPLVVVSGIALIGLSHLNRLIKFLWIKVVGILSLLLVFLFIFISFFGLGPLGAQLEQYTLKLRSLYISFGLRAILENPLTGVGVDRYGEAFRKYRSKELIDTYGVDLYTNNAHSTPVQIGVSFGIVVFLIYCIVQSLILFKALSFIFASTKFAPEIQAICIVWILVFAQSLLSIEIIGLGVINWVLGAVILSYDRREVWESGKSARSLKPSLRHRSPEWLGPVKIAVFTASLAPFLFIAREDAKWQTLSRLEVKTTQDAQYLERELSDLTSFTLLEPSKVSSIIPVLSKADMGAKVENIVDNLYLANPSDALAVEIKALSSRNMGKRAEEISIRLEFRKLDPLNYKMELQLAELLAEAQRLSELSESLKLIEEIAPSDSAEIRRVEFLRLEYLT